MAKKKTKQHVKEKTPEKISKAHSKNKNKNKSVRKQSFKSNKIFCKYFSFFSSSNKIYFYILCLVILFDRITKLIAEAISPYVLLPTVNILYRQNVGAAFSFLSNLAYANIFFLIICLAILGVLIFIYNSYEMNNKMRIGFILMIGGAISNLFDRLIYGAVIDVIDFHISIWHFATFNFADAAICVGAFIIIYNMFRSSFRKKSF